MSYDNPERGQVARNKQHAADLRRAEALLFDRGIEADGRVVLHYVDGTQDVFAFRDMEFWRKEPWGVEFHYFTGDHMDHFEIYPWHRIERVYVKGNSDEFVEAMDAMVTEVKSASAVAQVKF